MSSEDEAFRKAMAQDFREHPAILGLVERAGKRRTRARFFRTFAPAASLFLVLLAALFAAFGGGGGEPSFRNLAEATQHAYVDPDPLLNKLTNASRTRAGSPELEDAARLVLAGPSPSQLLSQSKNRANSVGLRVRVLARSGIEVEACRRWIAAAMGDRELLVQQTAVTWYVAITPEWNSDPVMAPRILELRKKIAKAGKAQGSNQ